MINNNLHFIITGGTMDSYYDVIKETSVPNEHSAIPGFIRILKLYETCEFTQICMKDSRELTDLDRKKILKIVAESKFNRIIITHGSYTVPETAKYLDKNLKNNDKVIILVCSMIPIKGFDPTDAGFNLGYAVAKSQDLSKGIYVCMNGRVFNPDEVVKILSEGKFGSIYTK